MRLRRSSMSSPSILAYLIVGVVVVEVVFVYPGLGQLMVDSVANRDLPVVQACSLIFAVTYILLNLISGCVIDRQQSTPVASEVMMGRLLQSAPLSAKLRAFDHHRLCLCRPVRALFWHPIAKPKWLARNMRLGASSSCSAPTTLGGIC